MLLFSVHPKPKGRKVDKMLTLKKVKKMVKAPVHTKRVPSPKVLLEDGRILLRKEFEHDSHLTLYHSGYVWFSTGKRNTVFHIHDCRGDYIVINSLRKLDVPKQPFMERPIDCKAGYKHHVTNEYLKHLQKSLMDFCRREFLHQVDLLSPSRTGVTEAEYWAQRRLDEKKQKIETEGFQKQKIEGSRKPQTAPRRIRGCVCSLCGPFYFVLFTAK